MRGEFLSVWPETWRFLWSKLAAFQAAPEDLFCELYREISEALNSPAETATFVEVVNDPQKARVFFRKIKATDIRSEQELIEFIEKAFAVLKDSETNTGELSRRYFSLLDSFIKKFSLRYELKQPCTLSTTLPGVFASLFNDLTAMTDQDVHLRSLMNDFRDAIRDLRFDRSENRIKTCIQKQVNLVEALGSNCANVRSTTLGAMCNEISTFPHQTIRDALSKVYGFTSNYPGIRHAGNAQGAIRAIELRDLIAITILLTGFTPYLRDQFNAEGVYKGAYYDH